MYCKIRDLEVHYQIIGEGKPIVMVHGMGVDQRTMTGCMEPVFQGREDEWRRIYFDLPGMGRTKGADWINNSDDMFRLILAFVDEVIPGESFVLVGESYGGYLVRALLRERPDDVEGMLLLCPLVVADDEQRDTPPGVVLWRDSALEELLQTDDRGFLDMFLVNQRVTHWERFRDEMLAAFRGGDAEFKAKIRQDIESYAFSFDVDDLARPFEKATLIVTGRQDCLVGYRDHWRLLENYPRASFVVLDMAGHGLQIEQADVFNVLVGEWLDRVKDGPAVEAFAK